MFKKFPEVVGSIGNICKFAVENDSQTQQKQNTMKLQSSFKVWKTINGKVWIIEVEIGKTVKYIYAKRAGWAHYSYCETLKGKDFKRDEIGYITELIINNK